MDSQLNIARKPEDRYVGKEMFQEGKSKEFDAYQKTLDNRIPEKFRFTTLTGNKASAMDYQKRLEEHIPTMFRINPVITPLPHSEMPELLPQPTTENIDPTNQYIMPKYTFVDGMPVSTSDAQVASRKQDLNKVKKPRGKLNVDLKQIPMKGAKKFLGF